MISRVLSVGFLSLFVALAAAPSSQSPSPCAEIASASADEITELAIGVAHALGSNEDASDVQKQEKQAEALACSVQGADEVVIVTAG